MQIKEMVIATAVLVTGCLSTPPYKPEDGVSFTETGTGVPGSRGATVAAPGFELHFADGDVFHFPDALKIDGTDVLGHDATSACFGQNELGFLIAPTSRISADGGAMVVTNRLEPVLRGPAVVQVKLTWATQLTCSAQRKPSGTATFTVFPDGRIVRFDTMADPSSASIAASTCSCGATDQQFNVITFWTFAGTGFRTLYAPDNNGVPLPLPQDKLIANYDTSCVADPAHQVALAWRETLNTELSSSPAVVRFGHTLSDVGASVLGSYSYENHSAIFIEHQAEEAGCTAARARAEAFVTPPHLFANDSEVRLGSDGIYGGTDGGLLPGLPVSGRVALTGPVKSSFAVWLRFPHAVDALDVTLEGATGSWYMPQRVDDTSWIVWVRAGLAPGQTIAIEPR